MAQFGSYSPYIHHNTFVLQTSGASVPTLNAGPSKGKERQNVMRLKVNRIALIQELRVEHVTVALLEAGVISASDVNKIDSGRTPQDKARVLVDLLPSKSKETEWYKCFREALLNPDAGSDTKRRYKLLVDFLDNTVIHRPTSQASRFRDAGRSRRNKVSLQPLQPGRKNSLPKLQHYNALPNIGSDDPGKRDTDTHTDLEDGMSMISFDSSRNMTLVKGFFHQWLPTPDNFKSLIEISRDHQQKLMTSENPEDQLLMAREEIALKNLRKVEVISAMARRKQLPSGFELCMCDAVQDILVQTELHQLLMKHLNTLEASEVMLMQDICTSYDTVLQMLDSSTISEVVTQVLQTGLRLASLLTTVQKLPEAEHILNSTVQFLKQNSELDSWLPRYQAYVKLMLICNLSCQPDKAQSAYFDAVQIQFQINMMSFGQKLVHQGAMHAETSFMLLEYGSVMSALGWARRGLMEVDPEDHSAVVRALCVGVNAYCAHWQVKKAEKLAIYAVQYARDKFGERHPMYIEALLHFCHYSNEFKQDAVGLKVAMEALDAAEKTYGCENMQLAYAHRAVSKARMCMHLLETEEYYTHAMEAVRMARSLLGQHSPVLHVFLHTFASALQWKALHCAKEVHDSTLRWAEVEAKQALTLVSDTFGEISLKSAQMLMLLGQIYSKMNKHPDIEEDLLDVAERHLIQAVDYLKLCQPAFSNYLLLANATLGTFYKIILKPDKAIPRFRFIVDHAESTGWYIKWLHTCFESLASLYGSLGQDKEANVVQVKLSHWLKANPVNSDPIDCAVFEEKPIPLSTFVQKTDLWGTTVQKVMTLETASIQPLPKTGEETGEIEHTSVVAEDKD